MSDGQGLFERTKRFLDECYQLHPREAEERLRPILTELMAAQGFDIQARRVGRASDHGLDFEGVARSGGPQQGRIGIEYKQYKNERPAGREVVLQAISLAERTRVDRMLLVSPTGFTSAARAQALGHIVGVQLLARDELQDLARAVDEITPTEPKIVAVIRRVSEEFAKIVARDPSELDALEWRDLERMMATVLDGLGFSAELTPGSKDGGKDIVVELNTESGPKTYIVELKHWRSGKRVGDSSVREFVKVVARERRDAGLFLSTYGFTENAFESLTEIERTKVKFGGRAKIVNLCRSFVRAGAGLWSPDDQGLTDLLLVDAVEDQGTS
ncbi:restriction endonuclease [Nocardia sp. NPDC059691]|uniref:restriction endonuclease n=1 Tax=Nocardia sp. NPDC059691 TaxID=3346908 RepID=UPI00367FA9EA